MLVKCLEHHLVRYDHAGLHIKNHIWHKLSDWCAGHHPSRSIPIIGLWGYQYVREKLSRNLHGTCNGMHLQVQQKRNNEPNIWRDTSHNCSIQRSCYQSGTGIKSPRVASGKPLVHIAEVDTSLAGSGTISPGKGVCGKYYIIILTNLIILWNSDIL